MKVGNVVTLKSGGPDMTIVQVDSDSMACHWFEGSVLRMNSYHEDALVVVRPKANNVESGNVLQQSYGARA